MTGNTIGIVLAAAAVGLGLAMIAYGFTPKHQPLAEIAATIRQPNRVIVAPTRWERLAQRMTGAPTRSRRADIALLERTPARHAVDKLGYAALLPVVPLALVAAGSVGSFQMSYVVVLMMVFGAALVGWVWPDAQLRSSAIKRRKAWGHALATYLDLVVILLAGGAGAEEALHTAAASGGGPEFGTLAATLGAARLELRDPWAALDELGATRGIRALRELAASMGLAGSEGARVRETLKAKAASLRERELAETESEAQRATETMSIAPAAMVGVFILLLGYPAIASFLGGG